MFCFESHKSAAGLLRLSWAGPGFFEKLYWESWTLHKYRSHFGSRYHNVTCYPRSVFIFPKCACCILPASLQPGRLASQRTPKTSGSAVLGLRVPRVCSIDLADPQGLHCLDLADPQGLQYWVRGLPVTIVDGSARKGA